MSLFTVNNKSRRTQRCDLTFAQLLKRLTLEFLNLKHSFENIKGFANLYNLHPSQQKHGDIEDCASKKYFSITSIDHFSQNRLIGIWNFTRCFIICNICFYSIVTLLLHIYSVLQMSWLHGANIQVNRIAHTIASWPVESDP